VKRGTLAKKTQIDNARNPSSNVRAKTASATSHRLHDGLRAFGSGFLILIFPRFTHPTGSAFAATVLLNGIRRP
jgi:hypothetical protein